MPPIRFIAVLEPIIYDLYYSLFPARNFLNEEDDKMWMPRKNKSNRSTSFIHLEFSKYFIDTGYMHKS